MDSVVNLKSTFLKVCGTFKERKKVGGKFKFDRIISKGRDSSDNIPKFERFSRSPFFWKLLKIGFVNVRVMIKKFPNLQGPPTQTVQF